MRFKEFLAESGRKREIDHSEAEAMLEEHCKDAMKLFHRPLWRGMTSGEDCYVLHGGAGTPRKSKNTRNYYTVIMDEFLPRLGYPKRSQSIICANEENRHYAASFGTLYAIFPYDGVPIGVCSNFDIWETRFGIGRHPAKRTPEAWNNLFQQYGLESESWEDFEDSLVYEMTETWAEGDDTGSENLKALRREKGRKLLEWFGPPEKIRGVFEKAYSPENMGLTLTTSDGVDKPRGPREVWISGPCVAIERDAYMHMLKEKGLAP